MSLIQQNMFFLNINSNATIHAILCSKNEIIYVRGYIRADTLFNITNELNIHETPSYSIMYFLKFNKYNNNPHLTSPCVPKKVLWTPAYILQQKEFFLYLKLFISKTIERLPGGSQDPRSIMFSGGNRLIDTIGTTSKNNFRDFSGKKQTNSFKFSKLLIFLKLFFIKSHFQSRILFIFFHVDSNNSKKIS